MSGRANIGLEDLAALKHEARGFSWLPRRPVASLLSGRFASRLRGRGLMFEEMRAYQPGDDIRQIDWKATARTRRTQLRVYSEERERSVLFLIDQRRCMHFGSRRATLAVAAAEAAAIGVWRALAMRDRVGALVFNDREIIEIKPRRSRKATMRILAETARLNGELGESAGDDGGIALAEVFARAARLASHDFLVVAVSSFRGTGAETRAHVARLSRHNDVISMYVYDPLEAALPPGGGVQLAGADDEMLEFPDDRRARERMRESFADEVRSLRDRGTSLRIPLLPLDCTREVAPQLRRMIGTSHTSSHG